jgi:hypothetical protein
MKGAFDQAQKLLLDWFMTFLYGFHETLFFSKMNKEWIDLLMFFFICILKAGQYCERVQRSHSQHIHSSLLQLSFPRKVQGREFFVLF